MVLPHLAYSLSFYPLTFWELGRALLTLWGERWGEEALLLVDDHMDSTLEHLPTVVQNLEASPMAAIPDEVAFRKKVLKVILVAEVVVRISQVAACIVSSNTEDTCHLVEDFP